MSEPGGVEAGWYPEPGNPGIERWWDGAQWTPRTRDAQDEDEPDTEPKKLSRREEREVARKAIICPHCGERGYVVAERIRRRTGVDGGKLAAAFFTLGFSMLIMGLSGHERSTRMKCYYCETTWLA
jgi:hypothetical protein